MAADAGTARVTGALLGDTHERIVQVDAYTVSVTPRGTLLVLRNADSPQVMGLVGSALARAGHFVDEYQQARRDRGGDVLVADPDRSAGERRTCSRSLRAMTDVRQVQQVIL